MSHEITLEQAADKANQAAVVLSLLKVCPQRLEEGEVEALATLLRSLVGNVYGWLAEEQEQRKGQQPCN
ncbi:hypothetical protein [Serratia fonticola]|uniref:hypothetical protein n=1 Tax=Serratia fonticola TaxID=47917 RepID=UPI0027E6BDE9|nr:hypothetical protein [Serratia fonticola]MDQ7209426.1 hypothetical protein [Serratia fonticola]HBE9082235.1 hypothetical protein [Serratia fonticola]HBE9092725.1 hypothetical protein [Serratia fonticola]